MKLVTQAEFLALICAGSSGNLSQKLSRTEQQTWHAKWKSTGGI